MYPWLHPEGLALAVLALAGFAEALHARRMRRVGRLAFGPDGTPRPWTSAVPFLRPVALALLTWGLATLGALGALFVKPRELSAGQWRHLVVALDVSPSMQLKDAGPGRQQTRAQRAAALVDSLLARIALDQVRISVVAFYTGAKTVVIDCRDVAVVQNILNDLPLEVAFDGGKTSLIDGVNTAAALGKAWMPGSATLLVVSDGDATPDQGLQPLPAAFSSVLVVGVGDTTSGMFIDGHQSRQNASALRQLATRLRGSYHDGNDRHLPSTDLVTLARVLPAKDGTGLDRRRAALLALGVGSGVMTLLPWALAFFGSPWPPPRRGASPLSSSSFSQPPAQSPVRSGPAPRRAFSP